MQRQGSNAGVVLEARQQPGSVMPIVRVLRISGSSWVVDMGEGGVLGGAALILETS